jgi:hypothetical protein
MPLQSKGIVTAEEGRRLFSNVKTLMAINQALLADLEARVGASQGNNIGECFLLFVHHPLFVCRVRRACVVWEACVMSCAL